MLAINLNFSNWIASHNDIITVNTAIMQQSIRMAIPTALYIHFFLLTQLVDTSRRTGRRYTQ